MYDPLIPLKFLRKLRGREGGRGVARGGGGKRKGGGREGGGEGREGERDEREREIQRDRECVREISRENRGGSIWPIANVRWSVVYVRCVCVCVRSTARRHVFTHYAH